MEVGVTGSLVQSGRPSRADAAESTSFCRVGLGVETRPGSQSTLGYPTEVWEVRGQGLGRHTDHCECAPATDSMGQAISELKQPPH